MIFRGTESVAGTNSKSDVLVTVEITTKDGIQIEIISKALKKYGDSICESVKEVLKNFKIDQNLNDLARYLVCNPLSAYYQ